MTIYRILSIIATAAAVPFVLLSIVFNGRPTLQNPALWVASDLYSRGILLLTPEERAQRAKKIYTNAAKARQKGSHAAADLLDAFAAAWSVAA